jgi:O-antigen ligase
MLGLAFAGTFVLFLSGLLRALSRGRTRALVVAIVVFGVVVALIGIVQKAVLGDHAYMGMKIYGFWTPESKLTVPFGPYVNRNHFAGWMLMALPLAIGYLCAAFERGARGGRTGWRNRLLWLSSKEGGRAQLTGFAIVIMALSLVMSMSRSGMAAFVVTSLFVVLRLILALGNWRSRAAAGALFLALIAAPLVMLGPESTVERFSSDSRGSIAMRRHVWTDARSIIHDFPLTGTGLNTFRIATVLYQTGSRQVTFQESHNDYLQLAAEGGLLLGVPAALAIVLLVVAVEDRTTYWIRLGAATGLVAIGLQSLVEFSLQMPGNAALFVVLLAVAMHRPDTTVRTTRA